MKRPVLYFHIPDKLEDAADILARLHEMCRERKLVVGTTEINWGQVVRVEASKRDGALLSLFFSDYLIKPSGLQRAVIDTRINASA